MRSLQWRIAATLLILSLSSCGGGSGGGEGAGGSGGGGPSALELMSDEFDDATTLSDWQRVYVEESWGFDQLESLDIDTTEPGSMYLLPYSSTWYQDWRGVLVFKEITGDFVATAHVEVNNRAETGPPGVHYSLGGIMTRVPRAVTPATWAPGGEDYVFLSIGTANTPGTWQSEVKTTDDSVSNLEIDPGGPEATLRTARIGPHMIVLLRWPGMDWQVHRRYRRDDFPEALQVGITTYTDWNTCSAAGVDTHNTTLLAGNPDLVCRVDYMRFVEPEIPAGLVGADLSNPAEVTDAELLAFLGL